MNDRVLANYWMGFLQTASYFRDRQLRRYRLLCQ